MTAKEPLRPCFDCGMPTRPVRVPRLWDDGRTRCLPCRGQRRARIVEHWMQAKARDADHHNRGGVSLPLPTQHLVS